MNIRNLSRCDVIRLDAGDQTYFTKEGYLIDHPIVTRIGIFVYHNPDGTVRRELRPPEEVFSAESLKSYEGKPVIITHDAGYVSKNNVSDEEIGTILAPGEKDGEFVRAKIVIHDTDSMRQSGFRELSLGYNLELDETPGEWNGEHYDAVQRRIVINHLALVDNARAGGNARLNVDSKDKSNPEGGKAMKKVTRKDGLGTPEEFAEAVEAYKQRKAARHEASGTETGAEGAGQTDGALEGQPAEAPAVAGPDEPTPPKGAVNPDAEGDTPDPAQPPAAAENADEGTEEPTVEQRVQAVKDRRDRRDAEDDPEDIGAAMKIVADQDEEIDELLSCIDALMAERDMNATNGDGEEAGCTGPENQDGDDEANRQAMNADSVDRIVSEKLAICRVGDRLNMDGLESMSILDAKKAVIKKIRPSMRLDGKDRSYIDAAYDIAVQETKKDGNYQRAQMTNSKRFDSAKPVKSAAETARERMISNRKGGKE